MALLEKLTAQYPDIPDFPGAEARAYDKLGSFHRHTGDWGLAEHDFRQAIAIQTTLVKQFPDAPYYGLWMATFRIALADALLRRNQAEEAQTVLEPTLSNLLRQLEQNPGVPRPHDLLALGYSRLEMALRQLGNRELANEAAQKAEKEQAAARGRTEN